MNFNVKEIELRQVAFFSHIPKTLTINVKFHEIISKLECFMYITYMLYVIKYQ